MLWSLCTVKHLPWSRDQPYETSSPPPLASCVWAPLMPASRSLLCTPLPRRSENWSHSNWETELAYRGGNIHNQRKVCSYFKKFWSKDLFFKLVLDTYCIYRKIVIIIKLVFPYFLLVDNIIKKWCKYHRASNAHGVKRAWMKHVWL